MFYPVQIPSWVKKIFPAYTWHIDTSEKILYLSFDDGPHPEATPFVLEQLKQAGAKASFFCIGKNVAEYPGIYQQILDEGHATGNHTQHHLNGWKTGTDIYYNDYVAAGKYIKKGLFRPPYGRIRRDQAAKIMADDRIIMWSVLSGDFDATISKNRCLNNVTANAKEGSIVVFHDSEKAFGLLKQVLPEVLKQFADKGYRFESLNHVQFRK